MNNMTFFGGKKVLIAGGTGTIGVPLVRRLLEYGSDITVVAQDLVDYAVWLFGDQVKYVRADLTDYEQCLRFTKDKDFVFNLVGIKGSTGIGETKVASYLVPMLRFQTNLMEAAFRNNVERFLFVSSICAYPHSELPRKETDLWDGLPKQNDRIPGLAKRIGEVQAESYFLEYGWEGTRIVRPSNVFGAYDDFDPRTAQVIPALISRILSGEAPLTVWGDGSAVRDFVYSEDVADWLIRVLMSEYSHEPFNIGSRDGVTIRQLAKTLIEQLNPGAEIQWDTSKPSGDSCRLLDMAKTDEYFGVIPGTALDEALARTASWYQSEYQNYCKLRGLL